MMRAYFRELVRRFRRVSPGQTVQISAEDVGLYRGDRPCARFAWSEVQEVVTFKVDLIVHDDIRLAFRVAGGWIEVSEDAEGWSSLTAALVCQFPTVPTDWYETVMLPPFESCYRVLYLRA